MRLNKGGLPPLLSNIRFQPDSYLLIINCADTD